jgi:hypothetical protein
VVYELAYLRIGGLTCGLAILHSIRLHHGASKEMILELRNVIVYSAYFSLHELRVVLNILPGLILKASCILDVHGRLAVHQGGVARARSQFILILKIGNKGFLKLTDGALFH